MTLPAASSPSACAGLLTRIALVVVAAVGMLAALAVSAGSAHANPPGPHDPFGVVEHFTVTNGVSVRATGWTGDPDTSTQNLLVYGAVDGHIAAHTTTNIARPWLAHIHHTSPTPGFDLTMPIPATGVHTVCIFAINLGPGVGRVLGCTTAPTGARLSAAQAAAHSPFGRLTTITANGNSLHVAGWGTEPDFVSGRMDVVLYVDGSPAATVTTIASTPAQRAAGAMGWGGYSITVPVSPGAHIGCVWAVNGGYGSNALLGCGSADTRGPAGAGPLPAPAVNAAALAEARKHLGQRYVWGAAGPTTFDCSGLVKYSYAKAGFTTPRIAADQFTAARLIPASRAVPGDLVFYHDSVGSVYHVGIYDGPGDTIAAIDQQEGIAHQHIWDPSSATYGSFTHT